MNPIRITLEIWPDGRVEVVTNRRESLPPIVKLSKSDPDFEEKLRDLKARGYKWNRQNKVWRLPVASATTESSKFEGWWGNSKEVGLSKDDPDFESKKDALKASGATWDGIDQVWVLP